MGITRRRFIAMITGGGIGAGIGAASAKEGEELDGAKRGAVVGGALVVGAHEMATSRHDRNAESGPDKDERMRHRQRLRDEQQYRDDGHNR